MILTKNEIIKGVLNGDIVIEPFDYKKLGTVSYKFKLSDQITEINHTVNSRNKHSVKIFKIEKEGIILYPNTLYLTHTDEFMGSNLFVQKIFGLREIANKGIFLNISANFGHIGAITKWTLELTVVHPLLLRPFQEIGQITFWKTLGKVSYYEGYYNFSNVHKASHCLF